MEERFSVLLLRTVLVGCLLGVSATVYFLFGLAGYVHSVWLNSSVVATLGFSALFFLAKFFSIPGHTNWLGRFLWAATLLLIVTQIALGLLPPTSRDELTHHLAIPKLYANAGRIIEVPIAPYAYYPMLLDMLYTPWVYWGYDFVPKLIHGLFAALTGLLLFAYLGRRLNTIYGLLGLFLYLSMPVVATESLGLYRPRNYVLYDCVAPVFARLARAKRSVILAQLRRSFTGVCACDQAQWVARRTGDRHALSARHRAPAASAMSRNQQRNRFVSRLDAVAVCAVGRQELAPDR